MSAAGLQPRSADRIAPRVRERWVQDVRDLVGQAKSWASGQGLTTSVQEVTLTEAGVGTYAVPVLTMEAADGSLTLEPVACRTPEADGRVDLSAYPGLSRILLLRHVAPSGTEWTVQTSDGLDWPSPWNEATFSHLVKGLLRVP